MKVLGARVEAALRAPADRALLVWPLVLGAPALRAAHPDGIPEPVLLAGAASMLGPLGVTDPGAASGCACRTPPSPRPAAGRRTRTGKAWPRW
jgi:hypothetical protein